MKRKKVNFNKSQKLFKNTANRTHMKNIVGLKPMRGGTRL